LADDGCHSQPEHEDMRATLRKEMEENDPIEVPASTGERE